MTISRLACRAALLPLLFTAFISCGDPFTLPPADTPTSERLVTLYAMTGTPIFRPSAFNVASGSEIRTDRSPDFDFALDFVVDSTRDLGTTGDTVVALLPRGVLGLPADPGIQVVDTPYDSLVLAPLTGYVNNHATKIDSGDVFVATSRQQTCNFGFIRPLYAKFEVLEVDYAQRLIRVMVRTDPNCGFRGLESGIPTR